MIADLPVRILRLAGVVTLCGVAAGVAGDLKPLALPPPQTDGGKPLMQALKARASTRAFAPEKLPPQVLSNLLWAAFGVNRADGRRTAPSAMNWQEIDIYVATADGAYLFDAVGHGLQAIGGDDIRAATGTQDFVKDAAVSLIYIADFAKMAKAQEPEKILCSAADTGFIAQNVYLFCSSESLASVVRASMDRPALVKALGLRPEQRVILVHSVGFPKR